MTELQCIVDELADSTDDDGDALDHLVCEVCAPDLALCGKYVGDLEWLPDEDMLTDEDICVVCDDLARTPCPTCGN